MELHRREILIRNAAKTVYGIVSPTHGLIKSIQEIDGEYVEVDEEPQVLVPETLERIVTVRKPIKIIEGGRGGGKSESKM